MEPHAHHRHHRHRPINPISCFIQSTATNLSSLFFTPKTTPLLNPPTISPILFTESTSSTLFESTTQRDSASSSSKLSSPSPVAAKKSMSSSSSSESGSRFPSTVRISGLKSAGKGGGGPAFVGQVFSMCDLSGTGLMAVTTHFDIPFLSKRTPQWLKKTFAAVTKSERNGPVFRFFMDLGDAVSYVKRLNIPSGVVGACRLDLAYEHFKEKPDLFQFVPNEKQVKEANKLLKLMPRSGQRKRVDGVPVFSAENLDIAIATMDGIKWYTPYFFDKNMLDNILEESVDQHFNTIIQSRHLQRRRDIVDDNIEGAEAFEEITESVWEPPEVQEVMDEMDLPGIPLSVLSKAAEVELLYAVDKVLLGNRWFRKATGIQPKFPYTVDSFEKRSAASFLRASEPSNCKQIEEHLNNTSEVEMKKNVPVEQGGYQPDFRFPFGDWLTHPRLEAPPKKNHNESTDERRENTSRECMKQELNSTSRFLPKITMVGISTGDGGQVSKTALKKSMEDLTRELERTEQGNMADNNINNKEFKCQDRDPLFVANVGDSYSVMSKSGSARWVRGGAN
ncbi:hypothetical protein LguiA_024129 [Lonicera macranthoides]